MRWLNSVEAAGVTLKNVVVRPICPVQHDIRKQVITTEDSATWGKSVAECRAASGQCLSQGKRGAHWKVVLVSKECVLLKSIR